MRNCALVCRYSSGQPDGIWDYTCNLAGALVRNEKINVDIHARLPSGDWLTLRVGRTLTRTGIRRRFEEGLKKYQAIVLQYNPFMYGRWGFAPWLVPALQARPPYTRLALMVHEPYVRMMNWRWTLMGIWQRAQLLALRLQANQIFVSTGVWAAELTDGWPRRETHHLPVGSNLPDMRAEREAQRTRLRMPAGAVVLATFGQNHHSRLAQYAVCAANSVATSGRPVTLMNLGDGLQGLTGLDERVSLLSPGSLPAEALARLLSTTDVYLA